MALNRIRMCTYKWIDVLDFLEGNLERPIAGVA